MISIGTTLTDMTSSMATVALTLVLVASAKPTRASFVKIVYGSVE